jgi:hypothetical protein
MMKRGIILWSAVALAIGLLLIFGGRKSPTAAAPNNGRTPVLVELFTSEGCSSCPPADDLLTEFEKTQPVPGAEVIALGQHVDYWNNGSWSDRFSSRAFSARQSDYATAFHNSQVYTPQMVVDGQAEFVGSDRDRAIQAIARAARAPKAEVQVTAGAISSGAVPLTIKIDRFPVSTVGDTARVFLAVTEDGLQSDVRGGENGGRTLRHCAVVRKMSLLGVVMPGSIFTAQSSIPIEAGWNRAHLQAVVFVQTQNSHQVMGVGATPLR